MKRILIGKGVVFMASILVTTVSSCGGPQTGGPEAAEASQGDFAHSDDGVYDPSSTQGKGDPVRTDGSPQGERRCTVTDSNGPLEGGEVITSGCAEGEVCACRAQAGYSCSGVCRSGGSAGKLEAVSE